MSFEVSLVGSSQSVGAELLTGPGARIVLAVAQQALLTPLGAERIVLGLRRPEGRFTVITTDASNRPEGGRAKFLWRDAAPIIAALRTQPVGGSGDLVSFHEQFIFRYAMEIEGSSEQVVVGVVLNERPVDARPIHAAVCSALYTLLPQSDSAIPDASVSASVTSAEDGVTASVWTIADPAPQLGEFTAPTAVEAIAQATIISAKAVVGLRFADQVAVDGEPVSLIVADTESGAVIGASAASAMIAPAFAVLKAANAAARIATEQGVSVPEVVSSPSLG